MKRRVILSSILFFILVLFHCTLFFAGLIENLLKLKPNLSSIEENAFEIHFIDVGQGDAIAIRFPNEQTMLVDSGPLLGAKNFKDYLNKVFFVDNYNTFDYVFLTHSDSDHSSNMEYVLNNYKVKNFYRPQIYSKTLEVDKEGFKVSNLYYDATITCLNKYQIPTFYFDDGIEFNIGENKIQIMCSKLVEKEPNDFSPLIIISSNSSKVALSGDMGVEQEKDIISDHVMPDVDLFKMAHHGSKNSNSAEILKALRPELVVASVGQNTYGHPSSEALIRLSNYDKDNDKNTYNTFKCTLNDGNVIYYKNPSGAINVVTIHALSEYLFVNYYVVVIVISVPIVVAIVIVLFPRLKFKRVKNIKW